jgi:hypothetical protein
VVPVLSVVVLFLTSARVIHEVQDAQRPPGAIEVTVVGHQFWWEFRYPQYGFVATNELHVPVVLRNNCPFRSSTRPRRSVWLLGKCLWRLSTIR